MDRNVYSDDDNVYDHPQINNIAPTRKSSSSATKSTAIGKTIDVQRMAEPVKPTGSAATQTSASTSMMATPIAPLMPVQPVFITASETSTPGPTAHFSQSNAPDNSSDNTASIITGVAFAVLILFVGVAFILRRMRNNQRKHVTEDPFMDEDSISINSKTRLTPSYIPYRNPDSKPSNVEMMNDSPRSSVLSSPRGETKINANPVIPSLARFSQGFARFSLNKKTDSWGNYVKQVLHKPTVNEGSNAQQPVSMSASAYGVCEVTIDPPETGRWKTESTVAPSMQQPVLTRDWHNHPQGGNTPSTLSQSFPQQQIIDSYHPLSPVNVQFNSVSPAPRSYQPTPNRGQKQQAVRINLADPNSHQVAFKTSGRPSYGSN
ncbi:hypothetical protein NQZ79_g1130 [Umbelopsis isabellina]|nr:hypothetical protein NQZ79_g1130 [Umbelopsis isabellina]